MNPKREKITQTIFKKPYKLLGRSAAKWETDMDQQSDNQKWEKQGITQHNQIISTVCLSLTVVSSASYGSLKWCCSS